MSSKFTRMEHLRPTPTKGQRDGVEEILVRLVQLLARQAAREHLINGQSEQLVTSTPAPNPSISDCEKDHE